MTASEDATDTTGWSRGRGAAGHGDATVITDARMSTSAEMSSRMKRYAITMAFRTACFVSMIFVRGPFLWVLFACAVFLPYVAVVLANQANQRTKKSTVAPADPSPAPQLTTGRVEIIPGDLVEGYVVDDEDEPDRRRRVA